ncbi:MAG TPA: LLM class flavin-dependent oxidoreductase [Chloroflexota bacterium]|nr:LLM class flavin-dependent oxidoreductase [Chloroflexota bacterium]
MSDQLFLNVLDQSPIRQGGTAAQALHETVQLAGVAERLGYRRYWVAEHHNTTSFAGTAPEVLIGQIAAHTSKIRVGSGGVMLSHYSALKVAEAFRVLAAFYPGRVDLGIGRAPGSDQRTALALAHPRPPADINQFPRQVTDLVSFVAGQLPEGHPFNGIAAQPGDPAADPPEIWLLGSSDYSAILAAELGLPFAFADFFGNSGDFGPEIAAIYRQRFTPSEYLAEPRVNVAVHVVCADTEAEAERRAASTKLRVVQMRTGSSRSALLAPEEASRQLAALGADRAVAAFTRHFIQGAPESVRAQLRAVVERYGAAELTIATNCYAFEDRARSYELVAQAMT